MTASPDPRRVSAASPLPVDPVDLASWNRGLNREHAMAGLRARGGRIVRAIEDRRRRLVAACVGAGPQGRAVDAGCEDGWMTAAWAAGCESLVLLDVDPQPLADAARSLAPLTHVRTAALDVTDPAAVAACLPTSSFDVVVVSALLEHVPEPDRVLEALMPALAPGGRLVAYVPADGPILAAKRVLKSTRLGFLVKGLPLDPAPGHLHRFDRRSFARLLGRHGVVTRIGFDPAVLGYLGVVRRAPVGA